MKKWYWAPIAVALLFGLYLLAARRNAPPEIPFTRITRETIISSLTTNGKVEPLVWATARAESAGLVVRTPVSRGALVAKGTTLAVLDSAGFESDLRGAQARLAQAQAERDLAAQGGRPSEISALDGSIEAAKLELATAQKDLDANLRLQSKSAVTGQEVTVARERADRARQQLTALERRRGAIVSPPDRASAEARIQQEQAAIDGVRRRIAMTAITAPIAGTVFQFDLKNGAYLNAGDLVASIGQLDSVRVLVYVDEPDLGRVEAGMPVRISWDALPGRQWTGQVERKAAQVTALGTRQVGEVACIIANPGRELLPGSNVNVEIRSKVVDGVVAVPNAALRREGGSVGVFVLERGTAVWRPLELGVASVVKSQVLKGLAEGDSVALPTDKAVKNAMPVTAVYP